MNSSFEVERARVLGSKLPSLDQVYEAMRNEESRKKEMNSLTYDSREQSAFVSFNKGGRVGKCLGRDGRPLPECPYCKRVGHVENKCWEKFPHLKVAAALKVGINAQKIANIVGSKHPFEALNTSDVETL